jgi:hypothetical protein
MNSPAAPMSEINLVCRIEALYEALQNRVWNLKEETEIILRYYKGMQFGAIKAEAGE